MNSKKPMFLLIALTLVSMGLNLPEDTTSRLIVRELRISGNTLISTEDLLEYMPDIYNASSQPLSKADSRFLYDLRIIHEIISEPNQPREVSLRTIQGLTQYILSVYQKKDYSGIYVFIPEGAIRNGVELVDGILPINILGEPVPPTKLSEQDSAKVIAVDSSKESQTPIAVVLGEDVYLPQNVSNYKGRYIRQMIFKALMEAYVVENKLSASPEEVDAALEFIINKQKELRSEREKRRKRLVEELKSSDIPEKRRKEGSKYLKKLNELIESDEKEEKEEESEEYRKYQRQYAEWLIESWRFDKALYNKYKGRVIFGKSLLLFEPIGSYYKWLKEHEAKKSFEVFEPSSREQFYDYFKGDRSDVPEKMVMLCFDKDKPFSLWTEAEQADWNKAGQNQLAQDYTAIKQKISDSVRRKPCDVITNSIGMRLVYVSAGEFEMGSSSGDSNERPQHRVRISQGFYMGVYEVTQAHWKTVMGTTLRELRDKADPSWLGLRVQGAHYPMYYVSWEEADEFCRNLSHREGKKYRLPTEAEWEYACRAGSNTCFSFGDDEALFPDYAWLPMNSGGQVRAVCWKKPNAWGLYDMHGNVCEWCSDWFDRDYYSKSPSVDPQGPSTGQERVSRGGCWIFTLGNCRSAERLAEPPNCRSDAFGFRIVLDLQK